MHKSSERSDDGCVWNEDAPTVVSCALFRLSEPVVIFNRRLFCIPTVCNPRTERTLTMENTKNNITINGNVTVNVTNNAITPTDTNKIKITENTTLGELLKLLNPGEKPHEIPTPKKLRENAGKPIAFYPVPESTSVENVECTVYSNGFAVYDNGSGRTVIWLPDCTSFTSDDLSNSLSHDSI